MLDVGEYRAQTNYPGISKAFKWVCGDAESLPFEDNTFDLYTIAFGIRNCTHVSKVLQEAFRVLKPHGKFACLEFSKVHQPLRPVYDLYSFQVIPLLGKVVASDYESYKYLVESIRMFPDQVIFAISGIFNAIILGRIFAHDSRRRLFFDYLSKSHIWSVCNSYRNQTKVNLGPSLLFVLLINDC